MLHVVFGNIVSLKRVLGVSPNVVGTLVPAVRATLKNAVFAFDSAKKAAPTQKNSTYIIFITKCFKFVVYAPKLSLIQEFYPEITLIVEV